MPECLLPDPSLSVLSTVSVEYGVYDLAFIIGSIDTAVADIPHSLTLPFVFNSEEISMRSGLRLFVGLGLNVKYEVYFNQFVEAGSCRKNIPPGFGRKKRQQLLYTTLPLCMIYIQWLGWRRLAQTL